MNLFILTHCAAEQNYTPQVCKTLDQAKEALKAEVENCIHSTIGDDDTFTEEEAMSCYVYSCEVYDTKAEIVYTDDTYDNFEIFEVDIPYSFIN